jgi:hypothetical protein
MLAGIRTGARALGIGVDAVGDRSMQAVRALLRNPTLAVAVATVLLFAVARIPTELFYGSFGVRPEDVGLNSVQVLLQGSAVILGLTLAISALAGLALVVAVAVITGAYSLVVGLTVGQRTKGRARRSIRRALRPGALLIPLISVALATVVLVEVALEDVETVGSGKRLEVIFVPWKATAVQASWDGARDRFRLPGCNLLYYLGEGNHRVVLYDAWRGHTYQVNSEDLQLRFPLNCQEYGARRIPH